MSFTPKTDLPAYLASSGLAHGDTFDAATQTYNITPVTFAKFRYQLSLAKAGLARCNVYFDGDSLTSGAGGIGTPAASAYTGIARSLMIASGRWGSIYEAGPITLDYLPPVDTDTRLTYTSNIQNFQGWGIASRAFWGYQGTNTTENIQFGPVVCDTFKVWDTLGNLPAGSGWYWSIDGGAETFVTQVGTRIEPRGNRVLTISAGSVGSHTLKLRAPGGNNYMAITGITYETAANTTGTYWYKRGVGTASLGDLNTGNNNGGEWNSYNSVALTDSKIAGASHPDPHLVVLMLGTNPEALGISSYVLHLTQRINALKAAGADVLLCVPPPGGGAGNVANSNITQVPALCYQVADSTNCGLFDMYNRWGAAPGAYLTNLYQTSGSSGHPNKQGHADMGFGMYNALVRVA